MSEFWRDIATNVISGVIVSMIVYSFPVIVAFLKWLFSGSDEPSRAPSRVREEYRSSGARAEATYAALNIIPLLTFPLMLYNFIVLTGIAPHGEVDGWMSSAIFTVGMFSGDALTVSFTEVFMGLALLLVFVEIVKATRTDAMSIINHGLTMLVCIMCLIQFTTMQGFSNTAFFWLVMMSVLDVVAGFTVTIVAARRDFGAGIAY